MEAVRPLRIPRPRIAARKAPALGIVPARAQIHVGTLLQFAGETKGCQRAAGDLAPRVVAHRRARNAAVAERAPDRAECVMSLPRARAARQCEQALVAVHVARRAVAQGIWLSGAARSWV
jgi:hypothetical protein